jgi:RNA polymerase subunit RPABC4/transcription elongation factor Spt4
MKTENTKESSPKKNIFLKIFLPIVCLVVIISLYVILMDFRVHPLLIILILGFVLLLFVGSFFIEKKQSPIYSKMFPDKKRRSQDFHRKLELKIEMEPEKPAQKSFKEVNLNFKYRKSLINKCENCGMLITGYRKNCPTCGQALEMKEIVKKCKNCGMLITKSVKICPICRKRTI